MRSIGADSHILGLPVAQSCLRLRLVIYCLPLCARSKGPYFHDNIITHTAAVPLLTSQTSFPSTSRYLRRRRRKGLSRLDRETCIQRQAFEDRASRIVGNNARCSTDAESPRQQSLMKSILRGLREPGDVKARIERAKLWKIGEKGVLLCVVPLIMLSCETTQVLNIYTST